MQSSSKSLKYNSEGYKSESFGYNLFRLLNFRVKKLFIRHLEKRNKIQTRKKIKILKTRELISVPSYDGSGIHRQPFVAWDQLPLTLCQCTVSCLVNWNEATATIK